MAIYDLGLDYGTPINWAHPLNRGLVERWQALPGQRGSGSLMGLTREQGRAGVLTNMDPATDWLADRHSQGAFSSLYVDGNTEYLDCGDVGVDVTGPLTISAWLKADFAMTNNPILGRYTETGPKGYVLYIHPTGDVPSLIVDGSAVLGTTQLTVGEWAHVAGVYNGATKKIYFNGVEEASNAQTTLQDAAINFSIGNYNLGGASNYFLGSFDDVRLWGRALSAHEIMQVYRLSMAALDPTLRRVIISPAAGWPHEYNSVANAGIDEILGVPVESINTVNSVA